MIVYLAEQVGLTRVVCTFNDCVQLYHWNKSLSSVCTALGLTVSSPVSVPSGVEIAATVCQTPC